MTAHELMEWAAYERTYGPILPHERIDVGFAQLSFYLVSLLGKTRRPPKVVDFLPPWLKPERKTQTPEALGAMMDSFAKGGHANH